MRMSGSQSFDRKNPSSPGSACCGDNVSKFSLFCQQLNHNNGSQHQQTPSSSHSSAFGFSLEAHLQPRSHSQQQPTLSRSHPQPHSHSQTQPQTCRPQGQSGEDGLCAAAGYDNGNRVFPLGVEQGYGSGYVSQELQDNSVRGLLKISPPDSPSFQATSPQALMTALSVLQQKIQQLQAVVQLIAQGGEQSVTAMAQQQAVATGVTSVVSQLIVTIAGILQQPAMTAAQPMASDAPLNHILGGDTGSGFDLFQNSGISSPLSAALGNTSSNSFVNYGNIEGGNGSLGVGLVGSMPFGGAVGNTGLSCSGVGAQSLGGQGIASLSGTSQQGSLTPNVGNTSGNSLSIAGGVNGSNSSGVRVGSNHGADGVGSLIFANGSAGSQLLLEEHDPNSGLRDDDDDGEGENLPPGSYELVEMEAIEILAEHTHFCEICGKGFKRDANLRMHMRGHGDEYKTPAALARPDKFSRDPSTVRPRRYSCPYEGCKRNKKHRKFLPLKTMLCVKNHYRRSHCPKMLTCTKCKTKKFSVVADLKTHEKHCGRDKWQCSCGTTFSRKDKLLGHIGLFAGHKSAYPLPDVEGCGGASEAETSGDRAGISNETTFLAGPGSSSFGHGSGTTFGVDMVAGHGSIMDVGSGSMLGVGIAGSLGRTGGLQNLGQRAGSLSFSNEKIGQFWGVDVDH